MELSYRRVIVRKVVFHVVATSKAEAQEPMLEDYLKYRKGIQLKNLPYKINTCVCVAKLYFFPVSQKID